MSQHGQDPTRPSLALQFEGKVDFWPDNPVSGVTSDLHGYVCKNEMRIGRTRYLSDTVKDLAWFSPAILYLYGAFQDRFLLDFASTREGNGVKWGYHVFKRRLFKGLTQPDGDPRWNHALFCINNHFWEAFLKFMISIVLQHSPRNWRAAVVHQEFPIPDPLCDKDDQGSLIWTPVAAFGLDATDGRFLLNFLHHRLQPVFEMFPASPAIQAFGAAIDQGLNPVDVSGIAHEKEIENEKQDDKDG